MTTQFSTSLPDHLSLSRRQRLSWVYRQLRIQIVSARWWQVFPGWELQPRTLHDEFFFLPMSHWLDGRVEEKRARVTPGRCMFVHAGQEHAATMPPKCQGMPIASIHVQLTPLWGGPLEQLFPEPFPNLPDFEASQARIMRVIHLMSADPSLGAAMGEQLIRDWLCFWAMNLKSDDPSLPPSDPRIGQALETIHERFSEPLSIESLAKSVGLGTVQFRKLFKLVQGTGPKAYLAQYRLRQAAQLLRLDVLSVKEISHTTGFTDPHYFHLAFRKAFGCTPIEYRSQSRQSV